jgi:ubiquinone/menaquinone biosynthesis C-methylase UbiE
MNAKQQMTQSEMWNGPSGHAWVKAQAVTDQMFRQIETLLVEAVGAGHKRVLDVGCGTGSTTLVVAKRWGVPCTGVDISAPMIAAAKERAKQEGVAADFLLADVQTQVFAPASFDTIISRFGVMFFEEPVKAFANLRRAASDNAALRCIAWRSPEENAFMTTAERAATPLLPSLQNLPQRRPGAPGQFAFADRQRVQGILEESGWRDIGIAPIDVECVLPAGDLDGYFTRLGPVGQAIQEAEEPLRSQIIDTVRKAFAPFVHGDEVRYTAACWMISARASASA